MTLIHELTELEHSLLLIHCLIFASSLKILDTLGFTEDMHGTFIEEILRILSLNFLNVRNIAYSFKRIINVSVTL